MRKKDKQFNLFDSDKTSVIRGVLGWLITCEETLEIIGKDAEGLSTLERQCDFRQRAKGLTNSIKILLEDLKEKELILKEQIGGD